MKQPRQIMKATGLILFLMLLESCTSATTGIPIPILATPIFTPTATPIPWQAPAEWWNKSQVEAFSSPLFESYAISSYANPPEYFYNIYSQVGVTLANWNDIRGIDTWREVYPQVVADLHARGIIVVGDIGLLTSLWDQTSAQELQPAIMRDPYGNALETNPCLQETPCTMPILSLLHPAAQEYYLSVVKFYIDSGVDGIMVDELAYGSVFLPDFNENTMLEFRQYLADIYTRDELAALGQPFGISDFSSLDYAALVRNTLPPDRTSLSPQDWQWEIWGNLPFWLDYQRFLRFKNHEFATWLISEGKSYAMETYGREIPFSANLGEITNSEALYLLDSLDYVDLEYHYQSLGYFPNTSAVTSVRIAQGFGKNPYLVTGYWDTDPDIAARGPERSKNLFRIMIADGLGTGAPFAIMEGLHQIKQDFTALTPYYRFPRDYPYLFNDMSPVKGHVGLLYLWEARDNYNYTDLRGLGQLLAHSGIQFNVIFGAEEHTWYGRPNYIVPAPDHPLTLEALTPNQMVILPQLDEITPNHAEILLQYVRQGGKLLVFTTPDLVGGIDSERGQSSPATRELLEAIYAGNISVGDGRIISVEELWGKPYATDPQPAMRQPLLDLLAAENILPEVSMSSTNYVGAFMHQGQDSMTVHFVNYDYNPDADTTTPAGPLQVEITLPDVLVSDNLSIYLYSPDAPMQVLNGEKNGNMLSLSLREFDIWSVLWIGEEENLQAGIATHPTGAPLPTRTPLPTSTPMPSIEPGYIIYDDALTVGWQASPFDAEANLNSSTLVFQGSKAIEIKAQGWGGLALNYKEPFDTSGYTWLILDVNPAEMGNLNFSITIFDQQKSVNYVFLSTYLEGNPLQSNVWRKIVIPISDLNPDGAAFDRIFIQNESDNPATFYLDEIFFATVP